MGLLTSTTDTSVVEGRGDTDGVLIKRRSDPDAELVVEGEREASESE